MEVVDGNASKLVPEELAASTRSAQALGVAPDAAAEGTRMAIAAGAQPSRFYHDVNHFADQVRGADDIERTLAAGGVNPEIARMMADAYRVAARDHDTVYAGADRGIPSDIEKNTNKFVERTEEAKYKIRRAEELGRLSSGEQKNARIAMATFGHKPGETLNPFAGQNEFLSTLHSLEANPGMSDPAKVAVSSMIESTIPFRGPNASQDLAGRVSNLGILDFEEARAVSLASADFANRDVSAFAGMAEQFQQHTHALLKEAGADLTNPESIVQKTIARANFFQDLGNDVRDGKREVFRNAQVLNHDGTTTSLLSSDELKDLNVRATAQLDREVNRLRALAAAGGEAMMNGRTVTGSVRFEDIAERAKQLMATTDPAEIKQRAEIAARLAKHA
jgi:hypothetical protein